MRKSALGKTFAFARTRAILLVIVGLVGMNGCSWFQFPGIYRLQIQQGNIITQEMVDQLEPGMTKRQVNFVLGTPLIMDSFQQNRWDYYYSLRNPEGQTTTERLTVYFQDDQLTHFVGDFRPSDVQTVDDSDIDEPPSS
ncbi:MAG: outer membrane protein assembly factor BamE [Cellvibrionaceae bacterium]